MKVAKQNGFATWELNSSSLYVTTKLYQDSVLLDMLYAS